MDLLGLNPMEHLREAHMTEDYATAASALCDGLGISNSIELLPFLRGVLAEVVKQEELANASKEATRARKGSAFSSYHGLQDEPANGQAGDDELEAAGKRWRRTLRAIFNAEAAMALLSDLATMYRSDDFARSARNLSARWRGSGKRYAEKMGDIEDLCLREVMGPLLARYGFSPDKKGSAELRAVIGNLSSGNKAIREKNTEIQRLIVAYFPNLASDSAKAEDEAQEDFLEEPVVDQGPLGGEHKNSEPPPSAFNWRPPVEQQKAQRVPAQKSALPYPNFA